MAYRSSPRAQRPARKQKAYFDGDVLDPVLLNAEAMQSPNDAHGFVGRKDSFVNSTDAWDPHLHGLPIDPGPPHHVPAPTYGQQPHPSWNLERHSGDSTATTGVGFAPPPAGPLLAENSPFAPAYHHPMPGAVAPMPAHLSNAHMSSPNPHMSPNPYPPTAVPVQPMSPHSHQDWMLFAQQEVDRMPKRHSPPVAMVDYSRRDGIRKKNGRIDIPSERNIHTIDELIDKTTDEDLLKELKQQKRLLRNREAALASRQRKKKHTEDLESKEKSYTHQIAILEKELQDRSIEFQQREHSLTHRLQESQSMIESLQEEMRSMRLAHNEETSSLRRKVNYLQDQADSCPAPAMSAAPSSTGFTDFAEELNALNMGTYELGMGQHEWDFLMANDLQQDADDFALDVRSDPPPMSSPMLTKRPSSSTMVPSPPKKPGNGNNDQPIATGLLFMLLLCGAFVASKPARSQPSGMPKMPAEVRAAAPAVLNNLLLEGAAPNAPATANMAHEPQASGTPYKTRRNANRLDQLHHHITAPTKQQELDQAAQLTTAQYASISNLNHEYGERPPSSHSQTPSGARRNLADILASMQQEHRQSSKAEVYTRSLLWEQIPVDVVRQFREMVRDHDEVEARQKQQGSRQRDEMYGFKVES